MRLQFSKIKLFWVGLEKWKIKRAWKGFDSINQNDLDRQYETEDFEDAAIKEFKMEKEPTKNRLLF